MRRFLLVGAPSASGSIDLKIEPRSGLPTPSPRPARKLRRPIMCMMRLLVSGPLEEALVGGDGHRQIDHVAVRGGEALAQPIEGAGVERSRGPPQGVAEGGLEKAPLHRR